MSFFGQPPHFFLLSSSSSPSSHFLFRFSFPLLLALAGFGFFFRCAFPPCLPVAQCLHPSCLYFSKQIRCFLEQQITRSANTSVGIIVQYFQVYSCCVMMDIFLSENVSPVNLPNSDCFNYVFALSVCVTVYFIPPLTWGFLLSVQ